MSKPAKNRAAELADVLIEYLEAYRNATPEARAEAIEQLRRGQKDREDKATSS